MIPLRDLNPTRRTPYVTYFLVAANILVFVYEVMIGQLQRSHQFAQFIYTFGAIPSEIVGVLLHPARWFPLPFGTLITSMFVHANFGHLAGNMLFLYIFGDNVEDELGHVRFVIFYLLCGFAGSFVHIVLGLSSQIPMVGASGAISGVMGAYILLFPGARILTLVFFFFITMIEVPAYWFIAIWFVFQFLGGLNRIGAGNMGGVAFWAHVGGFMAGLSLMRLWTRRWRKPRPWLE